MKTLNKFLLGTALAATVIGGSVALPATTAPTKPASAMGTCKEVRTTHTKKDCDKKKQICTYYSYKIVCGI